MRFVMHRDRTVASALGHAVEFKKGELTHVPPALYDEVLAAGAVPEDDLPEPESAKPDAEPTEPADRHALIEAAMESIVLRNVREEFSANGAPHPKALAKELGWPVGVKERDLVWAAFQQKSSQA